MLDDERCVMLPDRHVFDISLGSERGSRGHALSVGPLSVLTLTYSSPQSTFDGICASHYVSECEYVKMVQTHATAE